MEPIKKLNLRRIITMKLDSSFQNEASKSSNEMKELSFLDTLSLLDTKEDPIQLESLFTERLNDEQHKLIENNMDEVQKGAQVIDHLLGDIVSKYFQPVKPSRVYLFESWLVRSSNFSFKGKFDVVMAIINSHDELKELIDMKKFDDAFKKIMMFRNAFAHGQLYRDVRTGIHEIHHFHGKPEIHTLDSNRWIKLEKYYNRIFDELMAIRERLDDLGN